MQKSKSIPLFWWSESRLMGKKQENYGDLLSKYLVEKISGKSVKWVQPRKQPWYRLNKLNYLAVGSIIHHATKDSVVWGSGIIDKKQVIENADFRAVRGPETRKYLLSLGYECPEIYGDPALLLPRYFNPEVKKQFQLGVIPHYNDFKKVTEQYKNNKDLKVIDMMTNDVEAKTREILECEGIISSSLHGGILAHAYGIPAILVKFSDSVFGDGIKYQDYLASVGLGEHRQINLTSQTDLKELFKTHKSLPTRELITKLQEALLAACPFLT